MGEWGKGRERGLNEGGYGYGYGCFLIHLSGYPGTTLHQPDKEGVKSRKDGSVRSPSGSKCSEEKVFSEDFSVTALSDDRHSMKQLF